MSDVTTIHPDTEWWVVKNKETGERFTKLTRQGLLDTLDAIISDKTRYGLEWLLIVGHRGEREIADWRFQISFIRDVGIEAAIGVGWQNYMAEEDES